MGRARERGRVLRKRQKTDRDGVREERIVLSAYETVLDCDTRVLAVS